MTERSDLTTYWEEGPRLIEIADTSSEIVIQDLHDTLKSNTEQAGENDDSLDNMDDDPLIDSAGKEDLGGGVSVGITSTLQYSQVAFQSRLTPTSTGTVTTQDTNGTLLVDTSATFQTDLVERGAVIINFSDESITEVLKVLSETQLSCRVLRAGVGNTFEVNDSYKIWNIQQCDISGGNLVALDSDLATPISPVFPTAFTQIIRTSSSSATLQNQAQLQFSTFAGAVHIDVANGIAGTNYPVGTPGTPSNNLADAHAIAADLGIRKFQVAGNLTIDAGDHSDGHIFIGQGSSLTTFTVTAGANVNSCELHEATVTGVLGTTTTLRSCITDAIELGGFMFNCALRNGTTVKGTLHIIDSRSLIPGTSYPTVDMNNVAADLAVRNYVGGIGVINSTVSGNNFSLDLDPGTAHLDASNTEGTFVLRGAGVLNNNMTGNALCIFDGFTQGKHSRDLYKNEGLDTGNPMTVTPTSRETANGDVDLTLSGDGVTSTTVTRN